MNCSSKQQRTSALRQMRSECAARKEASSPRTRGACARTPSTPLRTSCRDRRRVASKEMVAKQKLRSPVRRTASQFLKSLFCFFFLLCAGSDFVRVSNGVCVSDSPISSLTRSSDCAPLFPPRSPLSPPRSPLSQRPISKKSKPLSSERERAEREKRREERCLPPIYRMRSAHCCRIRRDDPPTMAATVAAATAAVTRRRVRQEMRW